MREMNIHHVCIQTDVYEKSLWFYINVLRFDLVKESKDFHSRDYNTWLKMDNFYIELQTGKKDIKLDDCDGEAKGIVHMCFVVPNIHDEYDRIKSLGYEKFKVKNGKVIYKVEDGLLFKFYAPEGTLIEIRDSQTIC